MVVVTVVVAAMGRVVMERGTKTRTVVSGTNSASGPPGLRELTTALLSRVDWAGRGEKGHTFFQSLLPVAAFLLRLSSPSGDGCCGRVSGDDPEKQVCC